jgi:hypothetical protein
MTHELHIGTRPLAINHAVDAATLGEEPSRRKDPPCPGKEQTEEEQQQASHGWEIHYKILIRLQYLVFRRIFGEPLRAFPSNLCPWSWVLEA